ncbi:hypothetical protein AFLA70_6g007791 [Aspergillus flavus AF70]|nr:hypothetical protein AFLA70_6g007791 [Aspergillus flavus AF70]
MHCFPTQPENLLILTFSQARSKDDTNIFPLDGVDIESVSNEELVRLGETASVLYQIGSSKVLRISHDLVLKCGPLVLPSEGRALEFVRAKTSILVPRVYRSFQVDDPFEYYGTRGYLVMDYDDVICQTAVIIKQLQSIPIPTAGPLGGGPCRGKFFTDYGAGPFNSGAEMEAWFNHKLKICKDYNQAPQDIPPFDFQKFVLVHQDISPRNMILDATGKVCLIDWAHAGAYPPAFERAAIVEQHRFPEFNEMTLHVMPEYDVEVRQLQSIGYGLSVAGLA